MLLRKMMRFPKMLLSSEQNAKIFSEYTCDLYVSIPGRQSALKKALHFLGCLNFVKSQNCYSENSRRQRISQHIIGGTKV